MKSTTLILLAAAMAVGFAPQAKASTISLGSAGDFAVLAGSTVTNTGLSIVDGGNMGVSSGTAITGFGPGTLLAPFTMHLGDAVALAGQTALTSAYNAAAALGRDQDLTGQNLGGLTLLPGVYFFSSTAFLTGTLTLNNLGDPNAQFVFQIGSALTTSPDSAVVTINGGLTPGNSVFWQVGSSATLDTRTAFEGHILAQASITMNTGATLYDGSLLARDGAVTLETNGIVNAVAVPLPESAMMGLALLPIMLLARRRAVLVRN